MKASTLWQPWASLILIGAKPYEFRNASYRRYINPPKAGERIAIHAGSRPVRRSEVLDLVERLEADDPSVNPCLHRDVALPFLKRVLAGLAGRRKIAKRAADECRSLFDEERNLPASAAPATEREVRALGSPSEVEPFACPHSAILCTARLGEPMRGDKCAARFGRTSRPSLAGAVFRTGWPLLEIEPVFPHVEAHGRRGFWEWNPPSSSTEIAA